MSEFTFKDDLVDVIRDIALTGLGVFPERKLAEEYAPRAQREEFGRVSARRHYERKEVR